MGFLSWNRRYCPLRLRHFQTLVHPAGVVWGLDPMSLSLLRYGLCPQQAVQVRLQRLWVRQQEWDEVSPALECSLSLLMFYQARVSVFVHAGVSRICGTGEPTACIWSDFLWERLIDRRDANGAGRRKLCETRGLNKKQE